MEKYSLDAFAEFLNDQETTIDEFVTEYKESCTRNGKYDMKENAEWFVKENNLDKSCVEIIENILTQD